jgi:hypothetical protein
MGQSRWIRCVGHIAPVGEMRNAHNISVGKPEGKRALEKPRRRWKDIIKKDLNEVEWEDVE